MFCRNSLLTLSFDMQRQSDDDAAQANTVRLVRDSDTVWHCREYWSGDSRDGLYNNGDGYHYFEMQGDGAILKAYEYYETDDGEERVTALPELVGINWFEFFGFEDDELLEDVPEHEFAYVEQMQKK